MFAPLTHLSAKSSTTQILIIVVVAIVCIVVVVCIMGAMKLWNRNKDQKSNADVAIDDATPDGKLNDENGSDRDDTQSAQSKHRSIGASRGALARNTNDRRARREQYNGTPATPRPCQVDIYYEEHTTDGPYDQNRIHYLDNSDQERTLAEYQGYTDATPVVAIPRAKPIPASQHKSSPKMNHPSSILMDTPKETINRSPTRSSFSSKDDSLLEKAELIDYELDMIVTAPNDALTPSNTPVGEPLEQPLASPQKSPLFLNRQAARNISNDIRSDEFALID